MIWPLLNKPTLTKVLLVTLTLWLTACASGGLRETPKALPEPLPDAAEIAIPWWHILGEEFADPSLAGLKPAVLDETVYTALATGDIFRIDRNGKVTELGRMDTRVSAPLSLDERAMVVADEKGQVHLMSLDMAPIWTLELNALVTEAAVMTERRIFVQSIDGRVNAIERITGRLLWSYQDAEPDLTLTGTSQPVLVSTVQGDVLVTGLANGKVVALSVADGSVLWEYRITRASGKTDVSRLVDVDAQVTVLGNRLIASSYQGDLVVIDAGSGRVLQAIPFSTYRSMLTAENAWYGVQANSHVVALDPSTLEQQWVNTDLEYRQVSELVELDGALLMTDRKGYLHVIDTETGELLASRHIDWLGAQTDPVPFADGVLVQGISSRLKYIEIR